MVSRIPFAFALVSLGFSASAYECRLAARSDSEDGYGKRSGDYCDGVVQLGFSGGPQLMGYSFGNPVKGSAPLEMSIPKTNFPGPFQVQGVAVDAGYAYRLDGEIQIDGGVLAVGEDSVLAISDRPGSVGVVFGGWVELPGQHKTWVPVRIGAGDVLRIHFRTPDAIAGLLVWLGDEEIAGPQNAFQSNEMVTIEIPDRPSGVYLLKIKTFPRAVGRKPRETIESLWIGGD